MLESLEEIVEGIELAEKKLSVFELQVRALDEKMLRKVVNVAKKGIKWDKIQELNGYDHSNGIDYNDYFKEDEKYLKGIMVDYHTTRPIHEDNSRTDYELWLMSNGDFWVFKQYSKNFDMTDPKARKIVKKNINPTFDIALNEDLTENGIEKRWNIDYIVNRIREALNKRLSNLGDRCKTQKNRLEKLEELKIK